MDDLVNSMSESMIANAVEKMLYHFKVPLVESLYDLDFQRDPGVKFGPKGIVMTVFQHQRPVPLSAYLEDLLNCLDRNAICTHMEIIDVHCRFEPSFENQIEFFIYAIENE